MFKKLIYLFIYHNPQTKFKFGQKSYFLWSD